MTMHHIEPDQFTEKLTAVRLINQDTGQHFGTINDLDFFPSTISLTALVDFFNIRANTDYILIVTALSDNGVDYPVHATRVTIPEHKLTFTNSTIYGKANGNFGFNLTLQNSGDYYLNFNLIDETGKSVDNFYTYHTFLKR